MKVEGIHSMAYRNRKLEELLDDATNDVGANPLKVAM